MLKHILAMLKHILALQQGLGFSASVVGLNAVILLGKKCHTYTGLHLMMRTQLRGLL